MSPEALLFDTKIISLHDSAVKSGTQKKSPPRRRCGKGRPSCLENVGTRRIKQEESVSACIWQRSADAAWRGPERSWSGSTRACSAYAAGALRRGCGRPRHGSCRCPRGRSALSTSRSTKVGVDLSDAVADQNLAGLAVHSELEHPRSWIATSTGLVAGLNTVDASSTGQAPCSRSCPD